MKNQSRIVLLFAVLFMSLSLYGQNLLEKISIFRVETRDGNIFTGTIIAQDSASLVLKTSKFGEIRIPLSEIKSKTELSDAAVVNNRVWLPNPQSGRYFWAPNGYGLSEGKSYYQNIWVLYNQFSFGIADNFSLGGGVMPLFLFAGTPTPVWVVPKISIPVIRDKINVGTGALLGMFVGDVGESNSTFGLLYETTTLGSRDKNLSIGFAYGFASGEWISKPVVNISALIRTGPNSYFITENYLIPYVKESYSGYNVSRKNTSAVIISFGMRSIIRNVGLDYSIWVPINTNAEEFFAIPFLGLTIPVGKGK